MNIFFIKKKSSLGHGKENLKEALGKGTLLKGGNKVSVSLESKFCRRLFPLQKHLYCSTSVCTVLAEKAPSSSAASH